jgi:hypothetical protein
MLFSGSGTRLKNNGKVKKRKYGMGHYSDGQTKLYEILDSMNLSYSKEFCFIADKNCPNKHRIFVDAAIVERKIIIEYDGFPYHAFKKTVQNDKLRDTWFRNKGWKTLRIKGDEIQDAELVKLKIKEVFRESRIY